MAKINKWDALREYVSSCRLDVMTVNPTAEECGAFLHTRRYCTG